MTDIGEWFEGEISGDIQSDANEVVSHAEVFLNSMLCITHEKISLCQSSCSLWYVLCLHLV